MCPQWAAAAAAASAAAVFALEWASRGFYEPPLLRREGLPVRCLCYALLACAAAGVALLESRTAEQGARLKHGVCTSLAVWFVLMPAGEVTVRLVTPLWCASCCALAVFATHRACSRLSRAPAALAGLASCGVLGWVAFHGSRLAVARPLGGALLLVLAAYASVRFATDKLPDLLAQALAHARAHVHAHARRGREEPLPAWEGAVAIEKDSDQYRDIVEAFELACVTYAHKYEFWLRVVGIYHVDAGGVANGDGKPLEQTSNGRRLFHGTKRGSAQSIISNGFQLPSRKGMFGKGIYFADCPLKSWGYTGGDARMAGVILVCWVELGRPSHQKAARNTLTRPPHRSFSQWLKRESKYTSVVGDEEEIGGALRLPEYVIYDPSKAEIEYLIEAVKVPKGAPPPEPE